MNINREELKAYLPHRGINILPDELTMSEDGKSSTAKTIIPENDPHGRTVFGRIGADGIRYWQEPFLGELIALTGVPLLAKNLQKENKVSVFSMITKVSMKKLLPMNKEITCSTEIVRDRRGFVTFACKAFIDDELVIEAEILSGAASMDDIMSKPVRPISIETIDDITPNSHKDSEFTFINSIVSEDLENKTLTAYYHYPENHPLVPGHFPDAALMMGMSQWASVMDASWELKKKLGISDKEITATGTIRRENGDEVLNVRDLVLEEMPDGTPRIVSTKRVAFREPVRPGDGILIDVKIN